MRLLSIAVVLAALLFLPFLFWGEEFSRAFDAEKAIAWIRSWGAWSGVAVVALLVSDLVLPVPTTPIISAAGYLHGPWLGGLLGAAGSFASGMLGYGLSRAFGYRIAHRLAGGETLAANEARFRRSGPWLIVLSRWLPLLPEVVACLAGIAAMPVRTFAVALACGSLPMGFAYAAIGSSGRHHPQLALALSFLAPPLLWLAVRRFLR